METAGGLVLYFKHTVRVGLAWCRWEGPLWTMTALSLWLFHGCRVQVGKTEGKKVVDNLPSNGEFLKNAADQKWHCYGDKPSRLRAILTLTVDSFHLLLFSNLTPEVSITKEAAVSENRDVSHVGAGGGGGLQAVHHPLPAASWKTLMVHRRFSALLASFFPFIRALDAYW